MKIAEKTFRIIREFKNMFFDSLSKNRNLLKRNSIDMKNRIIKKLSTNLPKINIHKEFLIISSNCSLLPI
jgi:hypothetical protein